MTTTSIIPTAIDRLVSILSGGAFTVLDGPGVTDQKVTAALFIGWTDTDALEYDEAAVTDLTWAWLGHSVQDETARIRCVAESWNGNADMKAARDSVFATLEAVGAAIRSDPSLGLVATPVPGINLLQAMAIHGNSYEQNQTDDGAEARLQFDIEIRGRVH